jgi:hypothetical protein
MNVPTLNRKRNIKKKISCDDFIDVFNSMMKSHKILSSYDPDDIDRNIVTEVKFCEIEERGVYVSLTYRIYRGKLGNFRVKYSDSSRDDSKDEVIFEKDGEDIDTDVRGFWEDIYDKISAHLVMKKMVPKESKK